ncbi:transmembrane protein 81 [Anarhichas minor]|uniref:transmembrane protein 81 n=1 Tax=Anarhichas minor TaxID=65739 RepID=UPI003F73DCA5
MQHVTVWIDLLLLLLLFLHCLTSADLEEVDRMLVKVIVDSSPCSTTCGLGVKTQTLCLLEDGETATEEVTSKDGTKVSEDCRVRKVKCLESWQCGLRTMTVTSGERVEIDCLGEVMEAMGRFSWRVSWRYARGIITSDDSLFIRRDAPLLDRVILDPIREEDAGTYRCIVQDVTLRRVKSVYWGIRVLPVGILNLDYESSLAQWDSTGNQQNETASDQHHQKMALLYPMLISLSLSGVGAGLMLLALYWTVKRRGLNPHKRVCRGRSRTSEEENSTETDCLNAAEQLSSNVIKTKKYFTRFHLLDGGNREALMLEEADDGADSVQNQMKSCRFTIKSFRSDSSGSPARCAEIQIRFAAAFNLQSEGLTSTDNVRYASGYPTSRINFPNPVVSVVPAS